MFRLVASVGLALGCLGCTAVVSADEEQCESATDCEARGFAGASCVEKVCVQAAIDDPIWGCLGNVEEPTADPSKTVAFPIRLAFASDGTPVPTAAVIDVCDKLDIACTGNDANLPKGLSPGADGIIEIEVPEGFDGFVRVTHPEIVDSRVYVGRPIVEPPSVKEVQLFRPDEYSALTTLAGQSPDPERGTAIVLVVDCQPEAVGGVRLEIPTADADSVEFYLINQSPTIAPTATETDKDGFGGYFNLPAGSAVVRAFRAEDEAFVGESGFQILANTLSYVQVAPTPQSP